MILCELTPSGGSLIRMSTTDIVLTYQWFSHIKSLSSIKFALPSMMGGYAKPTFSILQLWPKMFEDLTWPPSNTADVVLKWTETDEASAITLFDGTATLDNYDRHAVSYTLAMPEFDVTIAESTAYSATLESVLITLCASLSLSTDFSSGRTTSPAVSYTTTSDVQAIDLMSAMCEFFTHGFKIIDSTLYLFDMLASGTAIDMDEFAFLPSSYRRPSPISLITSENGSVAGSNPNGKEIKISTEYCTSGNVAANLANIKTALEADIAEINCMVTDERPQVLETLTMLDESTAQDTSMGGRAISTLYNFDTERMQIEAVGVAS